MQRLQFTRLLFVGLCSLGVFCSSHAGDASPEKISLPPMKFIGVSESFYPPSALRNAAQGLVLMTFKIGANGKATDIRIVGAQPDHSFDAAALNYLGHHTRFSIPAGWATNSASQHFFRIVVEYKLRFCSRNSGCEAEETPDKDESGWNDGLIRITAERAREPITHNE